MIKWMIKAHRTEIGCQGGLPTQPQASGRLGPLLRVAGNKTVAELVDCHAAGHTLGRSDTASWLEHRRPVVFDADHGPSSRAGQLECLLGARGVVKLALGVIMQHQQPQRRPAGLLGEG